MKATLKLVAVAGIAGLGLAACGTSHSAAVNSTGSSTSSSATSSGPTTAVPAKAPVGFNAAKTEFVLPYKLGLLPASELALAKSNAAYAKGLANTQDWFQMETYLSPAGKPTATNTWFYAGSPVVIPASTQGLYVAAAKSVTIETNNGELSSGTVIHSASVTIQATTLNTLTAPASTRSSSGPELLAPSTLEIQAAPSGVLTVGGSNLGAFCVPTPEAYLSNNKVVTASGMPVITAGPSAIFAGENLASTSAAAAKSGPVLYDQGVASCANFK